MSASWRRRCERPGRGSAMARPIAVGQRRSCRRAREWRSRWRRRGWAWLASEPLEQAVRPRGGLNEVARHLEAAVIVERGAIRCGDARLGLDGQNVACAATVDLLAAVVDGRAIGEISVEDGVS